ncbi:hypothetical protein [Paenibacillus radicis (ex Gao et al. 2016)]|uniref:Uncharacterized protein n=1 Tax=Paenibacillus radicis (ex Gao et al. 2016) TaxID=1737354 RepID=A0A917HJB1_9BACL|nr:hypothetical protein [Paenibacillus radicis (ex Gao et al. 2016)]GGG81187.1 hypothetical protein GCM10010918_43000 [Paenibacillus radicis (ex Gao et al. 2016)]
MLKKKLIIVALTLVLSLTGVTSAFAYEGWADTKATAYQLQAPILGVSSLLDSPYDTDWYSWTNNTGSPRSFSAKLVSPAGKVYGFSIIVPGDIPRYYYDSTPDGFIKVSTTLTIAPGATVYIQVRGNTFDQFSTTEPYNFTVLY